jgi:hypothetical protein
MSTDKSREELAPGIVSGDFVPLSVPEFQNGNTIGIYTAAGALPPDPTFPIGASLELEGFPTKTLRDTPHNRAVYAAGATFSEGVKQASFYWRSGVVMDVAKDKKYRKHLDWEEGTIHAALLAAVCSVRGASRPLRRRCGQPWRRNSSATWPDETIRILVPVKATALGSRRGAEEKPERILTRCYVRRWIIRSPMDKPEAPPQLVISLSRVLVEATASGRAAYWLSVNGVRETLGVRRNEMDDAVTYAVAAGFVRSDEVPTRSLTVTYEGIDLARDEHGPSAARSKSSGRP